jgi:hypothetical protein
MFATVRLLGAPRCACLLLPEDHPIDVEIDRDGDAVPLYFFGRIGVLAGRFGAWRIAPAYLAESRRVGRDGYVGPAAEAPDGELAVRVCTGPGALEAVARGDRGLIRVALEDPQGVRFRIPARAAPPALVQLGGCEALRDVEIAPHTARLWLDACPSLCGVEGAGPIAELRRCGGAERLELWGEWLDLGLHDLAAREIRVTASAIHTRDAADRIRSLSGASVYASALPDVPMPRHNARPAERVADLPGDPVWQAELLAQAWGSDDAARTRAYRWISRCGADVATQRAQLRAALDAGVPIQRLWPVRRCLSSLAELPTREIRGWPGHTTTRVPVIDDADTPPDPIEAWVDDLALIEAGMAVNQELDGDPGEQLTAMASSHTIWRIRVLLEGRAERVRAGRDVTWVMRELRDALSLQTAYDHVLTPLWWSGPPREHTRMAKHGPAVLERLASADAGHPSLLNDFLHWVHHRETGPVGVELLDTAARSGSALALELLAEAALDGGTWDADARAEALRCVLRSAG